MSDRPNVIVVDENGVEEIRPATDAELATYVVVEPVAAPSPIELALQALRNDPMLKLDPATVAAIDAALPSPEVLK